MMFTYKGREILLFGLCIHQVINFSVESVYAALINNEIRVLQDIWQIKIPTRIKVFCGI